MSPFDKLYTDETSYVRSHTTHLRGVSRLLVLCTLGLFCMTGWGCSKTAAPKSKTHKTDTGETVSITLFTRKTELFMEHAPLVTRKNAAFLAHITWLGKTCIPVRTGQLAIDFMQGRQVVSTLKADTPLREGIFKPQGTMPMAGQYTLRLRLTTDSRKDTIYVKNAVVYASTAAARKANPTQPEDPKELSFLKEQQWKIPFATRRASTKRLHDGIQLSGVAQALPASYVKLKAPISGRITGLSKQLHEGHSLRKGQRVVFIEPILLAGTSLPQINQRIRSAQNSVRLGQLQLKRLRRMVKARAVASWQLSQVQHQINLYKTQLQAARSQRSLFFRSRRRGSGRSHAVLVRAPLTGTILKKWVTKGTFVTQGQPILELASLKQMQLVAQLPEYYARQAQKIHSATYRLFSDVERALAKPYAVGASIDPITRTLPLFFRIENPGFLKHNQRIEFKAHVSQKTVLSVPESALVDDQGTPVLFVQASGEAFIKRNVTTGIRDRGWVEIRSGLRVGERFVSLGAYELLLSQALKQAGGVDQGHAH